MGKLLSICIPTLQRKASIQSVLDSLLEVVGKHKDEVEICVSDNGSTDGTYEMLVSYSKRYPFIRVRRNSENIGFDANMATLAQMAEGRYCWPIGDDDEVVPTGVESLLALLKKDEWLAGLAFAGLQSDIKVMVKHFQAESYTRDEFVSHYIRYIRSTPYFAPGFGFLGCFVFDSAKLRGVLGRFEGNGYGWVHWTMYLHILSHSDGMVFIQHDTMLNYGSPPDKVYYPEQEVYTFSERKLKAVRAADLSPVLRIAVESVLTKLDGQYARGLLELILIKDIVPKEKYEKSKAKILEIGKSVPLLSPWGIAGLGLRALEAIPRAAFLFRIVPKLNNYSKKMRKHEKGLLQTNEQREAIDKWKNK
ncbi:MAG: glycosyltransferase family 2 protein [Candidatus Micrarchaeota archaeon]